MRGTATFDETRAALLWVPEPPDGGQKVGSGYFLTPTHVLTAGHVVSGRMGLTCEVRRHSTSAEWAVAEVVWVSEAYDAALLELARPQAGSGDWDLPRIGKLARNTRVPARLIGFPASEVFEDGDHKRVRDSKGVEGTIDSETGRHRRRLSLALSEPVPGYDGGDSPWGGVSGAGIFSGTALVGVTIVQRTDYGASVLTATPLAELVEADGFAAALGLVEPPALVNVGESREPAYWSTLRTIRARTGVLMGRGEELDRITAFASGEADPNGRGIGTRGYLWLVGGPWAGKSALMAEVVHTMPSNVDVVACFLIARESRASQEHFLATVVPQLAFLLGDDTVPTPDVDTFRALWERAEHHGRHVLLVVDGLDEDLGPRNRSVAGVLPERLGPRSRVIVTSRPFPGMPERVDLPGDVHVEHPLHAAATERILLTDSAAGAERRVLADQEIEALLSRLDDGAEAELGLDVLGYLTAAAGPLSVDDLAALIEGPPQSVRKFVRARAMRSLEAVGPSGRSRYTFAHQTLLDRCREDPDVGDRSYAGRLMEWAEEWRRKRWPPPDATSSGTPHYLLDNFPAVLASAHSASLRPADLVSDVAWMDAAIATLGVGQVNAALRLSAADDARRSGVSAMQRLVRLQADHLRLPGPATRPGYPATQLGWEALRGGFAEIATAAAERLRACPGPQLIPEWTTEQTSAGLIGTIGRQASAIGALAVTAAGRIVSGGLDGRLCLWDPDDPDQPSREIGRHGAATRALMAVGAGRVVSGGLDGALRLWDLASPGGPGREIGRHRAPVRALTLTDEGRVISGDDDGHLRSWDPLHADDPGREIGCHGAAVGALASVAAGRFVSSGRDGALRLWDPSDVACGQEIGRHGRPVRALVAIGALQLASGDDDGALRLWNLGNAGSPGREIGCHGAAVRALTLTSAGRVVSGGLDGMLRLWDPADPAAPGREIGHHGRPVRALALTSAGRVVSGGLDGALRLWDPGDPSLGIDPHPAVARALAVTSGGHVVWGDDEGTLRLWDPADGGPAREIGRHGTAVRALAHTPAGLVVSGGLDGALRLWDPSDRDDNGREIDRHGAVVGSLTLTSTGRIVSGGWDGSLRLCDPADPGAPGREIARHEAAVRALVATGGGHVIAADDEGALRLIDPGGARGPGRVIGRHTAPVRALALTGEGRLVSGDDDGTLRVWDLADADDAGREIGSHGAVVRALAVTCGERVVSGGADGILRLWNPARADDTGGEIAQGEGVARALVAMGDDRVILAAAGITGFHLVQ